MNLSEKWNAVQTNDSSYDGLFFYGVKSTGIFCRPSCPSRLPKMEHVVFFDSVREAVGSGYRPCKRCRPELAAYDPVRIIAAEAKSVIDCCYADRPLLQERLAGLGVSRRHLTQLFEETYGMSPDQYAASVRIDRAKQLLRSGESPTKAAFAVGMGTSAAFSAFFKKHTGMTPSAFAAREQAARPFAHIETPAGWIRLEENEQGICGLRFSDFPPEPADRMTQKSRYLTDAAKQLGEYFAGRRRAFDLPLSLAGSLFQQAVWRALGEIPYGETRSYQQVAAELGNPKAARAVGMANNRNPVLILVPCHRVVGKSGDIVGYAGGLERKRYLLEMERQNHMMSSLVETEQK